MGTAPVPYSPNMSYEQLIATLNQNSVIQQNENNTQIINDNSGVHRIIIGELPDGTFGIVVSKSGVNVLSLFS